MTELELADIQAATLRPRPSAGKERSVPLQQRVPRSRAVTH